MEVQRWWYDSNGKVNAKSSSPKNKKSQNGTASIVKNWKFNVLVNIDLNAHERIALSGNCDELGNWDPDHSVMLIRSKENVWSTDLQIPNDIEVQYRYFVSSVDPNTHAAGVHVRRWESNLKPRSIASGQHIENESIMDTFGTIGGIEKIDRGWLTNETIFQFKFFNNPFLMKDRIKNRLLYVKITPMNLRIHAENSTVTMDESLSNDTRENSTDQPAYAFCEVATLNGANYIFEPQEQFGRAYNPDDFMVFNITITEPENVAYLIDLYTYRSRAAAQDEPPYHLGYHYLLPNLLKHSEGQLEMPITCANKHRPLGMMKMNFVKITPLNHSKCDLRVSYARYWNPKWKGLDVGHRGAGTSFKSSSDGVIRENTIASLKRAAEHGADMVEFDVQLSKDLVPVIYHDFLVYVSLKKKMSLESNDMLELPMRELTLSQLKNLKVYHVFEGKNREAKFFDEDLAEHQPFPELADALVQIDPHCGFNIEIKSAQRLQDGTYESNHSPIDKNLYVDSILNVVLDKGGSRRIVFSCFDADICVMLRNKQNIYPVMFLTLGQTMRYPQYNDPRCNKIDHAVKFACANEILGIVPHSEDLLRDISQLNLAKDMGLIIFCWGDDNNSKDTIKYLKDMGLHAIIYDKVDVLKDMKESVFCVQAKDSQRALFEQIELEQIRSNGTTNDLAFRINS